MTKEDKEIIGTFLTKLSTQYVDDQGINSDYIRDNAFDYFKLRDLDRYSCPLRYSGLFDFSASYKLHWAVPRSIRSSRFDV